MAAKYICSPCAAKFHTLQGFMGHQCDDESLERFHREFPSCECGTILDRGPDGEYCPVCEA